MADSDSDAYWVGAFSISLAMAHAWLLTGRPDMAFHEIDSVLTDFAESSIWKDDQSLRDLLSPYWKPPVLERKELSA